MNKVVKSLELVAKVFLSILTGMIIFSVIVAVYFFGYYRGFVSGKYDSSEEYAGYVTSLVRKLSEVKSITPTPIVIVSKKDENQNNTSLIRQSNWGGPDLWEAVNKRRKELGVNPLNQKDNLCTIASIRLNELLELGTLDGHEGFSTMTEKRPDLKPIFENYSTVAEFLAAGGDSAIETVGLWENSLGHKKLLTGGEYVWGCIYAQNSFAVAIAAF